MWGLVYFVTLGGLALATFRKPYFSLVAFLCMFAVEQWGILYVPFVRNNGFLTNTIILAMFVLAAIKTMFVLATKKTSFFNFQFFNIKIRFYSAILFSYALISLMWTPTNADGWSIWQNKWPYLIVSILLAPFIVRRIDDFYKIQLWLIIIGGMIIALFATVPEWSNRHLVVEGADPLALPLTLAQLSGYILIASIIHYKNNITGIIWICILIIAVLLVMIKSGSRGQLVFSFFTVMMISPFVWGENIVRKILPGAILFTVLIYASSIIFEQTGMLGERWTADEVSSDFDERFSRSLLLLSKASESLGSFLFGLGNSASFSPNLIGIYPHIVPLEILGEEGLIGLFLFVTICYMVIRTFLKILKNKMVTSEEKKIVCVNFGFWLFTVLLCFKQSSLITSPNIFLFAALHEKLMALIYLRIKQGKSA